VPICARAAELGAADFTLFHRVAGHRAHPGARRPSRLSSHYLYDTWENSTTIAPARVSAGAMVRLLTTGRGRPAGCLRRVLRRAEAPDFVSIHRRGKGPCRLIASLWRAAGAALGPAVGCTCGHHVPAILAAGAAIQASSLLRTLQSRRGTFGARPTVATSVSHQPTSAPSVNSVRSPPSARCSSRLVVSLSTTVATYRLPAARSPSSSCCSPCRCAGITSSGIGFSGRRAW